MHFSNWSVALLILFIIGAAALPMCRESEIPLHQADFNVDSNKELAEAHKIAYYEPSDSPIVLMNPQYPHNSKSGPWAFVSSLNSIDPFSSNPFQSQPIPTNYSDMSTYAPAARAQLDQIMFMTIASLGAASLSWSTDILRMHVFVYRTREILEATLDQLRLYTSQMAVPPVFSSFATVTELSAQDIGGFLVNMDFGPFLFDSARAAQLGEVLKCDMADAGKDPVRALTSNLFAPEPGFSQGIKAWNTIMTSAIPGSGSTAYAQALSALQRMFSVVQNGNGKAKNILQIVGLIPDAADTEEVMRALLDWSASVGLSRLPAGHFTIGVILRDPASKVEFECIAFAGRSNEDIVVGNNPVVYRNASLFSHYAATPRLKRVFGGPAYPTLNADGSGEPHVVVEPNLADFSTFELQFERALANLGGIASAARKDITDMQWFYPMTGPQNLFFPYFSVHNAVAKVFNRTNIRLQARSEDVATAIPRYAGGSGNGAISGSIYGAWGVFVDMPNRALRASSDGNPLGVALFKTCVNTDIATCPVTMWRDLGGRVAQDAQSYYPSTVNTNSHA